MPWVPPITFADRPLTLQAQAGNIFFSYLIDKELCVTPSSVHESVAVSPKTAALSSLLGDQYCLRTRHNLNKIAGASATPAQKLTPYSTLSRHALRRCMPIRRKQFLAGASLKASVSSLSVRSA